MFLTSLTLRGFKSFADETTLTVEPGITVVVGPNGSGKSNVVDALSWVLGTNSARKVRGSAMTDVIFAGSPGRARARRARVEIVIDNSDGRLEGTGIGTAGSAGAFREVRVARTVDEDGLGTYELNGEEVRALDVQELLSDTGLGRELHTIVGQGQLDEILNARPEERRRFIEEAAGVLKHRRRRERAVRKLEAVDGHVEKLRTVLRELRRQLRPLEQQARAADRHAALQAELREVRVQLAAREAALLEREALAAGRTEEEALAEQQRLEDALAAARAEESAASTGMDEVARVGGVEEERYHALSRLGERLRGTHDLVVATRRRLTEAVREPLLERSGADLRERADEVARGRTDREAARDTSAADVDAARGALVEVEDRGRRRGEVVVLEQRVATREQERGRIEARVGELAARDATLAGEADTVRAEIQRLDEGERGLTDAVDLAEARLRAADERRTAVEGDVRAAESDRTAQAARAEALRAAAADASRGAAALVAADLDGVLGGLSDLLEVADGDRRAVAAALGPLAGAVAVEAEPALRRAAAWLRDARHGGASLLPTAQATGAASLPPAPLSVATLDRLRGARARAVAEVVRPAPGRAGADRVVATLGRVLATTYVVADWDAALALHARDPLLTFVTADGDVAGPLGYRVGAGLGSAGAALAAAEDAEARVAELTRRLADLATAAGEAEAALAGRRAERDAAVEALHASDARLTAAADRLERLEEERRGLADQRALLVGQRDELDAALTADREALAAAQADAGGDAAALAAAEAAAREAVVAARLALQRAEDELGRLDAEVAALRREADEVDAAQERAVARREARRDGVVRCEQLEALAARARRVLAAALEEADAARGVRAAEREQLRARVEAAREAAAAAARSVDRHREDRHRTQLARADVQARLGALEARIRTELSLSLDDLRTEQPDAAELDDARLVEREDVLVRRIGLLGRVNPLALEEFTALEERHRFLSDQLDDLRRSRRDLEEVISAVDDRIRVVFKEAFDDVAREFELTFATVFPGGKGRLVLTGAEDLLTAGVEVEARPPGKKVQRLSLLSGGERSLTVLAFVFAIFRARPSPFYVLDEVDAALDDVNLQRLLKVVRSFRGHAQVIMVTHQKRSMEIADLLYGITMGPDAVTKVLSERLRDRPAAEVLEARASDAATEALDDAAVAAVGSGVGAAGGPEPAAG
jgi:chromosome segregation protein